MSESGRRLRQSRFWLSAWVTAALVLAAATLLPWFVMAVERDDVEASESPLLLAVARQLSHGPSELYGPYGASNLLVLIHPPLYYRLAALSAWPIARAGVDVETAARFAGRTLSFLGWMATLAGAFVLARIPTAPRIAGWWAVLLVAATPVYGGLPFEVRPDLIGVALQTWGVVLVFAALPGNGPPDNLKILLAFAFFALAGCIKQHLVVTPGVAFFLLIGARTPGRPGWKTIAGALLLELLIILSFYGFEEWVTAGRMSRAMLAAKRAAVIHPSTWQNAGAFMLVLGWKCVGLIVVSAAAALAAVSRRDGLWRRVLTTTGAALIGLVAALTIAQVFAVTPWISQLIVLGLVVTTVCFAPKGAVALRRAWRGGEIDPALGVFLASELLLTAYLVERSTGAWYNYAVQAVVFASVLAARALARGIGETLPARPTPARAAVWNAMVRALEEALPEARGTKEHGTALKALARALDRPLPARAILAVVLAVLAVPAFALTDVKETIARRQAESVLIRRLFERTDAKPDAVFFADRPGLNRVHGRVDLVYDPWLYPVFESMGLAEPRSEWLVRALETGPVRLVVTSAPQTRIDGIPRELPELGYTLRLRMGPWLVWTRKLPPGGRGALALRPGPGLRRPARSAANSIGQTSDLLHSWESTNEFAECRLRPEFDQQKANDL
jgi:hypothetical protein